MSKQDGLPEIEDLDLELLEPDDPEVNEGEVFEKKANPMPKGLKYGLIMLPLVLIGVIAGFTGLKNTGPKAQLGIDGEVIPQDENSYVISSANASTHPNNIVSENGIVEKSVNGELKLTVSPMQKLQEQVVSLQAQMDEMSQVIKDLEAQGLVVNELKKQVSGLEVEIKRVPTRDEFEQVKSEFSVMMDKKTEELKSSLTKMYKKAKKVVSYKKKKSVAMPFRLVSIDQWDGVNYAAIQSTSVGGIENLRQGDSRSGWTVAEIDDMKMSVTFRHAKTGQTVTKNSI